MMAPIDCGRMASARAQRAAGGGPVAFQPQEHGLLRRSQVAFVSLLTETPAERGEHNAEL
ncbi:MAG: hypothetical protein WDM85_05485 [Caulobacteraceae bacterium]